MKVYWSTAYQYNMSFHGKTIQDRFLYILTFPHFSDNRDEPDKTDDDSDRL